MKIKIKYHDGMDDIKKIKQGDWIDLKAARDVFVPYMGLVNIPLGVSMKLPDGCEAIVLPRSSTFKRYGIIMANSAGVIDNSYSGTNDVWQFPAFCLVPNDIDEETGNAGSYIEEGTRICQFRVQRRMPAVEFEEVEALDDEDRGGFGSTGK